MHFSVRNSQQIVTSLVKTLLHALSVLVGEMYRVALAAGHGRMTLREHRLLALARSRVVASQVTRRLVTNAQFGWKIVARSRVARVSVQRRRSLIGAPHVTSTRNRDVLAVADVTACCLVVHVVIVDQPAGDGLVETRALIGDGRELTTGRLHQIARLNRVVLLELHAGADVHRRFVSTSADGLVQRAARQLVRVAACLVRALAYGQAEPLSGHRAIMRGTELTVD